MSRETDPLHPSVITIGQVEAGSAPNVIAENAMLRGSIRTTLPEVRRHLHRGLKRMVKALAELHGAEIDLQIREGYPPVINSPAETDIARRAALEIVGEKRLMAMEYPSMGSEDFAFYLQKLPGCYVRFGARKQEEEYIPLHSPAFDINEDVLKVGAAYFAAVAWEALTTYDAR